MPRAPQNKRPSPPPRPWRYPTCRPTSSALRLTRSAPHARRPRKESESRPVARSAGGNGHGFPARSENSCWTTRGCATRCAGPCSIAEGPATKHRGGSTGTSMRPSIAIREVPERSGVWGRSWKPQRSDLGEPRNPSPQRDLRIRGYAAALSARCADKVSSTVWGAIPTSRLTGIRSPGTSARHRLEWGRFGGSRQSLHALRVNQDRGVRGVAVPAPHSVLFHPRGLARRRQRRTTRRPPALGPRSPPPC
jgi:hypothetical protein